MIGQALSASARLEEPPHLRSLPGYLDDDIHDPEVGADVHRTPRELGLEDNFPQGPDR